MYRVTENTILNECNEITLRNVNGNVVGRVLEMHWSDKKRPQYEALRPNGVLAYRGDSKKHAINSLFV